MKRFSSAREILMNTIIIESNKSKQRISRIIERFCNFLNYSVVLLSTRLLIFLFCTYLAERYLTFSYRYSSLRTHITIVVQSLFCLLIPSLQTCSHLDTLHEFLLQSISKVSTSFFVFNQHSDPYNKIGSTQNRYVDCHFGS